MNRGAVLWGVAVVAAMAGGAAAQVVHVRNNTPSGGVMGVGSRPPADPEAERKQIAENCRKNFDLLAQYIAQQRHAPACELLRNTRGLLVDKDLAEQYLDFARQLNDIGLARLGEGDALFNQKRYEEAVRFYRGVSGTFAGLPVADEAAKRARGVENDPEVQAILAAQRAEALWATVTALLNRPARASTTASATAPAGEPGPPPALTAPEELARIQALPEGEFAEVVGILQRVTANFPGTPTARRAEAHLAALRADASMAGRIDRLAQLQRAESDLAKGRMYLKAGMLEKAQAIFEALRREYPDTAAADAANRELGVVQAEMLLRGKR